jgi:SAM-dependent methyltransferase
VRALLGIPAVYRAFSRAVGGDCRDVLAREYIRAAEGDRVLDIGCGPGDLLDNLPRVDYLGIDLDPNYIRAARERFGPRGEFRNEAVEDVAVRRPGTFDVVLAVGVLHHLDDPAAARLLSVARQALKPSGRLVAFDGCWFPGQSPAARLMLRLDRGRFVRSPEGYARLAREAFADVRGEVRHDLLRIPYTHHVMTCRAGPSPSAGADPSAVETRDHDA